MEGFQEGIFGFPHLKNIIDLQPRYWCDHLGMINESVGERNNFENEAGKKQVVRRFSKKEFWKYIGCILLSVAYDNKGCMIYGKTRESDNGKVKGKKPKDILTRKNIY